MTLILACMFCGAPCLVDNRHDYVECSACNVGAFWRAATRRWFVYLPASMVPTTYIIPRDGIYQVTVGMVRGTLDHPTTSPQQETP